MICIGKDQKDHMSELCGSILQEINILVYSSQTTYHGSLIYSYHSKSETWFPHEESRLPKGFKEALLYISYIYRSDQAWKRRARILTGNYCMESGNSDTNLKNFGVSYTLRKKN